MHGDSDVILSATRCHRHLVRKVRCSSAKSIVGPVFYIQTPLCTEVHQSSYTVYENPWFIKNFLQISELHLALFTLSSRALQNGDTVLCLLQRQHSLVYFVAIFCQVQLD